MANRKYTQSEHDEVIGVSAITYSKKTEMGYRISTNPDGEKNWGWADMGLYPDLAVWKPTNPGGSGGLASIIEEIEPGYKLYDKILRPARVRIAKTK